MCCCVGHLLDPQDEARNTSSDTQSYELMHLCSGQNILLSNVLLATITCYKVIQLLALCA